MKLGRVRQMRIMYIDDLKKKKDKASDFSIPSWYAIKKKNFFFQLHLPAIPKRLILLADNNLNYPSHLREHYLQMTESGK